MKPNFLICSGYFERSPNAQDFSRLWLANIKKYAQPAPSKIVVISVGGCSLPFVDEAVEEIQLTGNCGHGHHLLGLEQPSKPHAYSGWSAAALSGLMIAYANETDAIFVEQDALCFGDWVKEVYASLEGNHCTFGGQMRSAPYMPSHQSVFAVSHASIPAFVRAYLGLGDERHKDRLVEHKFAALRRVLKCGTLPVGFMDRMRPKSWEKMEGYKAWSMQQLSEAELDTLKAMGKL